MNRRDVLKTVSGLAAVSLSTPAAVIAEWQIASGAMQVSLYADGRYSVTAQNWNWTFAGALGRAVTGVSANTGADSVGAWQELSFNYGTGRSSAIRLYNGKNVVLFRTTYGAAAQNSDPFPSFTTYPLGLNTFSYGGLWAYKFGQLNAHSPWLFFDGDANSFLFSPASNFMTAIGQIAADGSLQAGIDPRIGALPASFTHSSVLVFENGINAAFDAWGQALMGLSGKQQPANDAVTVLNKLSYWTDAIAAYYYYRQSEPTAYVPMLLQIPAAFAKNSAPLGSLELDSWHYPKGSPPSWTNVAAGLSSFEADWTLFPSGLAPFQKELGLPLIAHTRWIDPSSPYAATYQMSGNVAIDPAYWQTYARYMASNGIEVLEQDWLSSPANTNFNLTDPDAFLDNMASALAAQGRSIIYCMPVAAHLMQASKYSNVVAARVSPDGFNRTQWDQFLFNSRIAAATGVWPFTDACQSQNVKDVLFATLSAGPLGMGENMANINAANLSQAVRPDGVIVKPDVPIAATDSTFLANAQGTVEPNVAYTYAQHGALRTAYVLAYDPTSGAMSPLAIAPATFGVSGSAYVYDYFNKTGELLPAGAAFSTTVDSTGSYFVVAPVGPSGIAFLGDAGKFVGSGKKRIAQLTDDGALQVTVLFAPGEDQVALQFYSAGAPETSAAAGAVSRPWRDGPGRYRVLVSPGAGGSATITIQPAAAGLARRPSHV